jgi:hypothetical protein
MDVSAGERALPKHAHYGDLYRRWGFFWGLGVEHETYVRTACVRDVSGSWSPEMLKPERYCVNYYAVYKKELLAAALGAALAARGGRMTVPVLMNNHSFTDCDLSAEHKTTYERVPKPNPRFAGQTLYEYLCSHSDWLRNERGRAFTWDGDTVEFMTQRFYRATVDNVMTELVSAEERFVRELNAVPRRGILASHGPFALAEPRNEPWATYLTNPRGVSMFNNGTIHVNVTLPTRLDWTGRRPLFWEDFVERHRRLARLIQWMEPLWIAVYGSGDPFATIAGPSGELFAAGSQRLAVSRYIGVGTYDTVQMPTGKILQIMAPAGRFPWYDRLYERMGGYERLGVVGLDLNFNKHWAHGLEIRIFDQMPRVALREVLEQVVMLMDVAEEGRDIPDPRAAAVWNAAVIAAIHRGEAWDVEPAFLNDTAIRAFGCRVEYQKEPMAPVVALAWLTELLERRRGRCWGWMVGGGGRPTWCC